MDCLFNKVEMGEVEMVEIEMNRLDHQTTTDSTGQKRKRGREGTLTN